MGALTVTIPNERRGVMGNVRYIVVNIRFSTSYATGGDTGLTAAALGIDAVDLVHFDNPAGYVLAYNYSNGQVLASLQGAFTVTTHGTHQHDITTVAAAGAGTAMLTPMVAGSLEGGAQVNTNAVNASAAIAHVAVAAGALAEVAAATNLSTIASAGLTNAIRCIVFGR